MPPVWRNASWGCLLNPPSSAAISRQSGGPTIPIRSRRSTSNCSRNCCDVSGAGPPHPADRDPPLMSTSQPRLAARGQKDLLFLHLRDLPYFRALLRAVESTFYQDRPLPSPIYDVGCGDGHFASVTFDQPVDIGLDPWHGPIHEARRYAAYRGLVEADGAHAPFREACFASAFSNSVLEHIPNIDDVLIETARLLKPGAPFFFCVPNTNFTRYLSVARFLEVIVLNPLAQAYRRFFNRISRHIHLDTPE